MLQQKGRDYKSIIGFLLMGVILIWYLNSNKSNIENGVQEEITTEQQNNLPREETIVIQKHDSIEFKKQNISDTTVLLENDYLKIGFNSKGGKISYLELKKYKTYRGNKLDIINDDNSNFDISFYLNEKKINSSQIYFTPSIEDNNSDSVIIKMTSSLDENSFLQYVYILDKHSHILGLEINSKGIKLENLNWDMNSKHTEKSITNEDRYTNLSYFDIEKQKVKDLSVTGEDQEKINYLGWIAFKQQFFSSILLSDDALKNVNLDSKSLVKEDSSHIKYFSASIPLDKDKYNFKLYFVPNKYNLLVKYGNDFDELIPLGWGIFGWVNKYFVIPIFNLLLSWNINMGIIILILTVLVKLILSPITYKNFISSAKMRILRPEIEQINEKYKNQDAMKRQQATMELYNKAGVNPLAGCIPMLLQLPVLIAMFRFFPAAIELRSQKFLWADDLSSYDSILNLGFNIPLYGDHISLFTLLMSVALLVYTYMSGGNMDQPTQPGMPNMKVMMYMMPVMMIIWFNDYASGLSYYYFLSNAISILQMVVIKRFVIDENKLRAKIEENKKKDRPKGRWQKKLEELSKQRKNLKK